ncbi:MAG: protein kinase [Actinomycetota bacterium]
MEIRVLGPISVTDGDDGGELGERQARLLAALVVADGETVSLDRLLDIVWAGEPPGSADATLRTYLTRLRRAMGSPDPDPLPSRPPGYALAVGRDRVDAWLFENEVDRAGALLKAAEPDRALEVADVALGRWRGEPFGGLGDEDWCRTASIHLAGRRREVEVLRVEAMLAVGVADRAVTEAQRLVAAHPLDAAPRSALMRALHAAGRAADAFRVLPEFRRVLEEEVGLDPPDELVELEARLASGAAESGGLPSGRYRLLERLGEGAFATVHKAVQPGVDREVAVKVIRAELADRPDFVRRFEAEAKLVARLEHPHIVPLYDYWREPGAAYLVMRLMRGGSLEDVIRRRGGLGPDEALDVLDQVSGALDLAHRQGVVHRDVKPANVLVDDTGQSYVSDFGIAAAVGQRELLSSGSPAYAAPEQLRGEAAGVAADVHGLALTAFEALTGRLPLDESDGRAALPPIRTIRPELPSGLDAVLARGTDARPERRHASALALVADLRAALGAGGVSAVRAPATVGPDAENPYVGLVTFDEPDADRFHGRDEVIGRVVSRLAEERLVVVVGPSGSGKSSVVRAGVVPAVRRGAIPGSDGWFVTTMVPGRDPFAALETALLRVAVNPPTSLRDQLMEPGGLGRAVRRVLPDDRGELLVVVDQFEELFTLGPAEVTTAFLDELATALTDPDSPLRVVATLRADQYDAPLGHTGMAGLLEGATVTVPPMRADEVEQAIVAPSRAVGIEVEAGLVAQLVAETAGRATALPLLQFSLAELFARRSGGPLTLADHEELGGMAGALATGADRIVTGPEREAAARRLFGRLVVVGEDGPEDLRRRALRSEVDEPTTSALIDELVEARLLAASRDPRSRAATVEVAHEALLREWPRLRAWLDEDRGDLRTRRDVTIAADRWIDCDRKEDDLGRGARLDVALDLSVRRPDLVSTSEREWVEASVAARDAEQQLERERAERDRRQNRRLRRSLAVVGVLLVVALVAGALAVTQQRRADDEAEAARAAADEAELATLVSRSAASARDNPDVALLLALEANRRAPGPETEQAVLNALGSTSLTTVAAFPPVQSEQCQFATIGSNGERSFAEADGVLVSRDLLTGEVTEHGPAPAPCVSWVGDEGLDRTVAFVGDEGRYWVGPYDGAFDTERVFDVPTYGLLSSLRPTGRYYVISEPPSGPPEFLLLDDRTLETIGEPINGGEDFFANEITDDGSLVALSFATPARPGGDGELIVVDGVTAEVRFRVQTPLPVGELIFDEFAPELVGATLDGRLLTVDLETGEVVADVGVTTTSGVTEMEIGPDGLVTVVSGGLLEVVDRRTGPVGTPVDLREVEDARIRPDGLLLSIEPGGATRVIDPFGNALVERTRDVDPFARMILADGFAASGGFGSAPPEIVELSTGERTPFEQIGVDGEPYQPFEVVPDATGSWSMSFDEAVTRWEDGGAVASVPVSGPIYGAHLEGDRWVIWTGEPEVDATFDVVTLDPAAAAIELSVTVPGAAIAFPSIDGGLHTWGPDGTMTTFDAAGESIGEISTGLAFVSHAAVDPTSGRVALADSDTGVVIVDPATGEVQELSGTGGTVNVGFARDGQYLVLTGADGTVRLWDLDREASAGLVWDGDGTSTSSGPWYDEENDSVWVVTSGQVIEVPLDPAAWIEQACATAGRELTPDEWARLVPGGEPQTSACG